MADDDNFVRITFRMPKDLHQKLTDAAAKKRSMNAEIIERLEQSFTNRSFSSDVSGEDLARTTRELMDVVDDLKGANRYYVLGMRMILERILFDEGKVDDETMARIKQFVTSENLFEPIKKPEDK